MNTSPHNYTIKYRYPPFGRWRKVPATAHELTNVIIRPDATGKLAMHHEGALRLEVQRANGAGMLVVSDASKVEIELGNDWLVHALKLQAQSKEAENGRNQDGNR